jgi:mannosyltransferase
MSASTTYEAPSAAEPAAAEEPRPARGPLATLRNWLPWAVPMLLTLALGVYQSGRAQLWMDELATWNAASRSTGQLYHMLHHVDAVTGVYYLVIHYWAEAFGHSTAMLRLPSALAMAAAAAFTALTARKAFGTRAAWVAGLVFAVIPSVARYAQETRGYAFVVLAAAAATFLLLRALERPTVLRWLLYAVSVCAAGVFHMIALVFLASHALIVALRWWAQRDRRLLIGFPAATALGMLPVLPLVVIGQRQVGRQLSWLTKPTLEYVFDWFWKGLYGSSWVSVCVLALAVLPLAWAKGRRPAVEIGLIAVLPIVLVWFVSQGHTAYFFDRYLLFTLPAWTVLAGAGAAALRPRALAPAAVVLVMLVSVHDQRAIREPYARTNWDAKAAAAVIAKDYRPGDGVVPLRDQLAFMQVDVALKLYLPAQDTLKDVLITKDANTRGDLYATECPDPAACLAAANAPRVWVVTQGWTDTPFKGFSDEKVKALKAAYPKQTSTAVPGMVITLMER